MSKTIKRLLIAGLMCLSTTAIALDLKTDAPQRYTVQKGDTLWDISERFTDEAWQWPEIWYLNPQIENPHLIYPGDEIGLITVGGQQRVGVTQRGDTSRTVKLSPGDVKLMATARVEPIESAIPAIPMDAIRGFLRNHRVVDPAELAAAPHVISGVDEHLLMGAVSAIYARGKVDQVASAYSIFRKGQVYKDPETDEILGLEATDIGLGRVTKTEGDIMTLMLEKTNQQVAVGDRLLETEDRSLASSFIPKAPAQEVIGTILAVSGGVSQVGQYDVVVLNRGKRDGLEQGSVLLIEKAGVMVYDREAKEKVRLPREEAGSMMVFRVFDKMSYALIMRAVRPLRVGDMFNSPKQ